MGILVKELTPVFGAEVRGVDLAALLDDQIFAEVRDAFHKYAVRSCLHSPPKRSSCTGTPGGSTTS